MKRAATRITVLGGTALALAVVFTGCGKMKQNDPQEAAKVRAEAKRRQAACASPRAYDRLKGILFDRAISEHDGDRANLDTLADYSLVRMEDPVVRGWDPALDLTRCKGRFILEIPPGAERAFAGERRLQAEIDYTAQASADGRGFVYQLSGAEPMVAKLAGFNLTSRAFRPSPAIDDQHAGAETSEPTAIVRAEAPEAPPAGAQLAPAAPERLPSGRRPGLGPAGGSEQTTRDQRQSSPVIPASEAGETTVRAFYIALGSGDGRAASAHIIPEKRSSGAFAPSAISRFYGRLPEPIRLTDIVALADGRYRVSYRYSAGRSRCDGRAVVSLTNRGGRDFIRSIRALSGC